eukprot:7147164-Lingulodinium_polyedra.AAC.1
MPCPAQPVRVRSAPWAGRPWPGRVPRGVLQAYRQLSGLGEGPYGGGAVLADMAGPSRFDVGRVPSAEEVARAPCAGVLA